MQNLKSKVLIAVSFMTAVGVASAKGAASPRVHVIHMTAKRFVFTPNVITVKQGERVRITITALDRKHGFALPAYHIKQVLLKGDRTTIEFTANKAGTFPFHCSVFCGLGHHKMKGKLIVLPAQK